MSAPAAQQSIKRAGIIILATAIVLVGPTLLGLYGFFRALIGGFIPMNLVGIESVILTLVGLVILALKISSGLELRRLQAGAWLPAVAVTGLELLLIAYGQARVALSETVQGAQGLWFIMPVFLVVADLATLALLYSPSARAAFPDSAQRSSSGHEARVRYCRELRDGWQEIGNGPGYTIINIGPANFILAPFYWLVAGAFYLVVVLPFRPWDGR